MIMLSAMGRDNSKLVLAAAMASRGVISTTVAFCIDSFQETPQFGDVSLRNQLNPSLVFDNLHLLPWPKMQIVADRTRDDHLILGRYRDRLHAMSSIDHFRYYNTMIDVFRQRPASQRRASTDLNCALARKQLGYVYPKMGGG